MLDLSILVLVRPPENQTIKAPCIGELANGHRCGEPQDGPSQQVLMANTNESATEMLTRAP